MILTGPDISDQLEPISARGWPPEVVETLGQWRLHATRGHSGRANACWPIGAPDRPLGEAVLAVEAWYGDRGLPPLFRPADLPATEALRGVLAGWGYGPRTQTLVMVGPLAEGASQDVRIAADPGDAFSGVFLATAHDPDDAAERMETLLRLAHPRAFAHVERDGAALAIGALAVEGEWAILTLKDGEMTAGPIRIGAAARAH
ncbi:MAG: hypothetical protein P4L64_02975 [Caulobacteraceae bacterium]|nr:hypothetical protein [Caulobacteraceae bacterium]